MSGFHIDAFFEAISKENTQRNQMNTNDKIELPPLPSPFGIVDPMGSGEKIYTLKDMGDYARAYARAAIEAALQSQDREDAERLERRRYNGGADMSERLTAEKARDIARAKDPAFAALDEILAGIEKAACEGKYEYITRNYGFGSGECYTSEDKYPALCQAILKELRALGFKANVRSECRQFVDLWLSVTWEKP